MTEAVSITRARPILGDHGQAIARGPIVLADHGRAITSIVSIAPGQADDPGDRPEAAGEALAG